MQVEILGVNYEIKELDIIDENPNVLGNSTRNIISFRKTRIKRKRRLSRKFIKFNLPSPKK